jgi:hypothetical protein
MPQAKKNVKLKDQGPKSDPKGGKHHHHGHAGSTGGGGGGGNVPGGIIGSPPIRPQ